MSPYLLRHFILLHVLLVCATAAAQDESIPTLKIKKPVAKQVPEGGVRLLVYGGANYTFTGAGVGWDAGARAERWWIKYGHGVAAGFEYARVMRGFEVSAWDKNLQAPVNGYARSETILTCYKFPVMLVNAMKIGKGMCPFDFGLVAAVPHSVKNEHDRLRKEDFRSFNIAARVSFGRYIYNGGGIGIQLTYSADLLNNLKDPDIYDASGTVIDRQKSKVHLLSLQLTISPWMK